MSLLIYQQIKICTFKMYEEIWIKQYDTLLREYNDYRYEYRK